MIRQPPFDRLSVPRPMDFRAIGKHMSRERYQRGSLKKVGKIRKMWRGRWHIYVKRPDGSEKLCKREKVLGPVSDLTKAQAQEKLDALIKASAGQISIQQAADSTFADEWKQYAALKSGSWSTATRKAITSVFAGESAKKEQPSVLAMIGARQVQELTRGPLQDLLNQMALRGDSHSAVKKARTYLASALEYARDERLISDNPARKLELPTQLLRKPCERYYSHEEVRRLFSHAHGREHLVLRIFINCGLRPSELFALREDDVETANSESMRRSRRSSAATGVSERQRQQAAEHTSGLARGCRMSLRSECRRVGSNVLTTQPLPRHPASCSSRLKPARPFASATI